MFHKKLDMLMRLTDTKNSTLAMQTSLDASHISRLRRGERRLVRDADYVKAMAGYFARQLGEDYRKQVVAEAMNKPVELLQDQESMADAICAWFVGEKDFAAEPVGRFLAGFKTNFGARMPTPDSSLAVPVEKPSGNVELHYGNQGKRESVISILTQMLQSDKPVTLLLYSDEEMSWLTEDSRFQMQWGYLLQKVIAKGGKIRIIHTVSRNLGEMLEGLSKWMPLYMTGAIEPYYYPRKRDSVFLRTLYIAEGVAAITSSSVGGGMQRPLSILIREPEAVGALAEEFYTYLTQCRSLMRILQEHQIEERSLIRERFRDTSADLAIMSSRLLIDTMPHELRKRMTQRVGLDADLPEIPGSILSHAETVLAGHKVWQAIRLPDEKSIREGTVQSELMGTDGKRVCYLAEEYAEHLEYLIHLQEKYDNYHIVLDHNNLGAEYDLIIGESQEAIIRKSTSPQVLFQIDESNLVAAFWDYFMMMIAPCNYDKDGVIRELQELIDKLR